MNRFTTSRPPRRAAWLLALALGASFSAAAHSGPGSDAHPHGGRMAQHAMPGQSLQQLKDRLKLTPAQEGAWSAYTAALQTRPAHAGAHAQSHQELMALSTPERIARMKTLRAQHQAEMNAFMDRRGEATQTFYAALSPEQQKVFDAETVRQPRRHGHGQGHQGHPGGHSHGGPGRS